MLSYLPFYPDRLAPFIAYRRVNGLVYYLYKDLLSLFSADKNTPLGLHDKFKLRYDELKIRLYSIGAKRESSLIDFGSMACYSDCSCPFSAASGGFPSRLMELETLFLDLDGALALASLVSAPGSYENYARFMTEFAQRLARPLGSAGGGQVTFSGKSTASAGTLGRCGGFPGSSGGDGDSPAIEEAVGFREVASGATDAVKTESLPVMLARPFDEERDSELPVAQATPFEGEVDPSMPSFQIVYRNEESVLVRVSSAPPSFDGASAPPFPEPVAEPSVEDQAGAPAQASVPDPPPAEPVASADIAVSSLVEPAGGEGGVPASSVDDPVVPPAPQEEKECQDDEEGDVFVIPLDHIAQGTQAYCIVLGGEQYLSAKDVTASLMERLLGNASSASYVTKKWDKVYEDARDRLGVLKPFRIPGRFFLEPLVVIAL